MEKIDFDIRMIPITSKSPKKDISLVRDIASASQKIKNVVSLNEEELPFSNLLGANILSYIKSGTFNIFLIEKINSTVTYAVKDVFNVSSLVTIPPDKPNILRVVVNFSYNPLSRSTKPPNNSITLEINIT